MFSPRIAPQRKQGRHTGVAKVGLMTPNPGSFSGMVISGEHHEIGRPFF
ncbi:hypothetical protein [Candidatus Williamhamiltonella defendens]|nr:hypothetical protein [Candidatus Hamiltonella defensa]